MNEKWRLILIYPADERTVKMQPGHHDIDLAGNNGWISGSPSSPGTAVDIRISIVHRNADVCLDLPRSPGNGKDIGIHPFTRKERYFSLLSGNDR
jgi:hypothetical protein